MSSRNRLIVPIILSFALAFLVACGSSNHTVTPPPSGGFTNSNLNGTYVFSIVGSDATVVPSPLFALAGTLQANGSGVISGGTLDFNDPAVGAFPHQTITSGSYNITKDGRGTASIKAGGASFAFDFVLSSSSHGLIIRYDSGGTGSGTIDLQTTVSQSQVAGPYAFSFSGASNSVPFATAGAFTLDANGAISTGLEDFNNNGSSAGLTNLSLTGTVSVAIVPGTATFTTSAGTLTFDVFPVDPTHLKFIEVDANPVLAGDAFTQSTSMPTGTNVFTISGFDSTISAPFTAVGLLVTDGAGNVTSGSTEDINDAGVASLVTGFTGTYTALSGGRSVLTLNSFNNGANGLLGSYQFAVYPSTGGLNILEIDNAGITGGVAYPQTSSTLASSQGYGLNLTGSNSNGEEDDIAEFNNASGAFTGTVDFNDQGATTFNRSYTATYAADAAVASRATIASNAFNLVSYVVDSSTTVFVEVDNNQVGIGSFQLQSASAKSNSAATHLAVLRLTSAAHKAWQRKKK